MNEINSTDEQDAVRRLEILHVLDQWQDAIQGFDEAIGNKLGLINAEHRCLKALIDGPKTAGQLAVASGLTPAAATSMIDRLEKRGFVERQRDETDRRKVVVAMTQPASDTLDTFYKPLAHDAAAMLANFGQTELSVVEAFVKKAFALQQAHRERVVAETVAP